MGHLLRAFVSSLLSLGILGVFSIAILDSTFLFFMPFAIDWIFIILVSHHNARAPIYILVTVLGSLAGCLITYFILSKVSEETLDKHLGRKLKKVKSKLQQQGFKTLLVAALLPPPFPFTAFTMTASVAEVPVRKVTGAVLIGRTVRFVGEALLAVFIGGRILKLLDSTIFQAAMLGLFGLAVIGSAYSIYRWVRKK